MSNISKLTVAKLQKQANTLKIKGRTTLRKAELIQAITAVKGGSNALTIAKTIKDKSAKTGKGKKVVKKLTGIDKNPVITITCGDVAENHVGNQQIGHLVAKGNGFDIKDFKKARKKFMKAGYKVQIFNLNKALKGVKIENAAPAEQADIMIIRNGLEALIGKGHRQELFEQLNVLDWDKKFWDARRKKVLNKHARHNLCFSKNAQEPDYPAGKGRIVSFRTIPFLEEIMGKLPKFFGKKAEALKAEGNKYYDKSKTGIGYHGDSERRKVIAWRLGKGDYGDPRGAMSMHWQWYAKSKPVGKNMKFIINAGDIYLMSEKATGQDWKKSVVQGVACPSGCKKEALLTVRHAAGSAKYTKLKKKK